MLSNIVHKESENRSFYIHYYIRNIQKVMNILISYIFQNFSKKCPENVSIFGAPDPWKKQEILDTLFRS